MSSRKYQRGYTLVEMVGAMFVMGTLMAMVSVYGNHRVHVLDRAASQIASSLRLARSRALLNSRPTGVQFRPQADLYVVFEDVGLDGLAPGDGGYTEADEGERNNRHDFDLEAGHAEPASDFKNTLLEGISFAILADPESMNPDSSAAIGTDPIPPLTRALVFDARGQLVDCAAGANFVYLANAQRTEMRAIRVDPWNGYVQVYRWDMDAKDWRY
jgi:prepilin-type N-terminal cleavage/methylation domain-containing protein